MKKNQIRNLFITFFAMIGSLNAQCFIEENGVVSIEAEEFSSQEKDSKRKWYVIGNNVNTPNPDPDGSHASSASGRKYIEALPDTRVTHNDAVVVGTNFTDVAGQVAVLNYKVNFKTTGRFYVWIRLYSSGSEDNGVHVGINNTWPESGKRMQWCAGKNNWTWESKQRTSQEHCGVERQIFIDVPSPGVHTFQLSMREDGVEIDKIVLSKAYTKPIGNGPTVVRGLCGLPTVTNNSSIAVVADGNSPDPDDIGGTAVTLAILRALGAENDLVYYSHSCDLVTDPSRISDAMQEQRQILMQTSCDGTASRWGGFDHITFYNCRKQKNTAIQKLTQAINAATSVKPLTIILAGEPDIIYDAIAAAQSSKRRYVTIVSHHIANEESADGANKNISDLERVFPTVQVVRIPDQNVLLQTPLSDWNWARDHQDSKIKWLWDQGRIAEQDPVVGFQRGKFDCSDAGMVYFQLTGDRNPDVSKIRALFDAYLVNSGNTPSNSVPTVSVTSPVNNAVYTLGETITLKASASDPDGNLNKVNFKINDAYYSTKTNRPFESTFTPTVVGTYKIAARAFDGENLQAEDFVTITVINVNNPPTVSVRYPINGSSFQIGEEIELKASASDPDGNLDRISFKINDSFYRSESNRPFTTTFTPTVAGTYKIAARAFDRENLQEEDFVMINVVGVSSRISKETIFGSDNSKRFVVYPNPASDYFIIDMNDILQPEIRIYNSIGHLIMDSKPLENTIKISTAEIFPSGIYHIVISDKNGTTYKTTLNIK